MIGMTKRLISAGSRIAPAVFIALTIAACQSTPAIISPGIPPQLKHSWEVAFNRGDADAVAALYASDGQLLMSGANPVRGVSDIKETVQTLIKAGAKVKIETEENVACGEIAYVFGAYHMVQKETGLELEHGSYIEIWRRRNGIWKIILDVNASGTAVESK